MSLEGVAGGRNVGRPLPEIPSHAAQKFQAVAQEIDHVAGPILRGVTPDEGPSHPTETRLVLVSSDDILGNPPDDPWDEIDAYLSEKVDIPTVSDPPKPRSSRLSYDEDSGHLMPFRREATPDDLAFDEIIESLAKDDESLPVDRQRDPTSPGEQNAFLETETSDEDSGHLMPFRREATPKDLALDELLEGLAKDDESLPVERQRDPLSPGDQKAFLETETRNLKLALEGWRGNDVKAARHGIEELASRPWVRALLESGEAEGLQALIAWQQQQQLQAMKTTIDGLKRKTGKLACGDGQIQLAQRESRKGFLSYLCDRTGASDDAKRAAEAALTQITEFSKVIPNSRSDLQESLQTLGKSEWFRGVLRHHPEVAEKFFEASQALFRSGKMSGEEVCLLIDVSACVRKTPIATQFRAFVSMCAGPVIATVSISDDVSFSELSEHAALADALEAADISKEGKEAVQVFRSTIENAAPKCIEREVKALVAEIRDGDEESVVHALDAINDMMVSTLVGRNVDALQAMKSQLESHLVGISDKAEEKSIRDSLKSIEGNLAFPDLSDDIINQLKTVRSCLEDELKTVRSRLEDKAVGIATNCFEVSCSQVGDRTIDGTSVQDAAKDEFALVMAQLPPSKQAEVYRALIDSKAPGVKSAVTDVLRSQGKTMEALMDELVPDGAVQDAQQLREKAIASGRKSAQYKEAVKNTTEDLVGISAAASLERNPVIWEVEDAAKAEFNLSPKISRALGSHVRRSILDQASLPDAQKMVGFWIDVANQAVEMGDDATASSIYNALTRAKLGDKLFPQLFVDEPELKEKFEALKGRCGSAEAFKKSPGKVVTEIGSMQFKVTTAQEANRGLELNIREALRDIPESDEEQRKAVIDRLTKKDNEEKRGYVIMAMTPILDAQDAAREFIATHRQSTTILGDIHGEMGRFAESIDGLIARFHDDKKPDLRPEVEEKLKQYRADLAAEVAVASEKGFDGESWIEKKMLILQEDYSLWVEDKQKLGELLKGRS